MQIYHMEPCVFHITVNSSNRIETNGKVSKKHSQPCQNIPRLPPFIHLTAVKLSVVLT